MQSKDSTQQPLSHMSIFFFYLQAKTLLTPVIKAQSSVWAISNKSLWIMFTSQGTDKNNWWLNDADPKQNLF